MTLFPNLPFNPEETHLSFAARLAAFHTNGRLNPFLNHLGVRAVDFAAGKLGAVTSFCERAGADPDQVVRNTPISVSKMRYKLRGEIISADVLANPHTCFCPACLLADDAAGGDPALARHERMEWILRVVRTCPRHGLPLIARPRQRWDDQFHELAVRVPETGAELRRLVDQAAPRSISPLQAYALARLDGATGPEWLDSQTLEQAVRATEMLGALAAFGAPRRVSDLTEDEWDRAGRVAGHERRGSHDWPGRGAILGLMGASLGIRRADTAGQEELGRWRTAVAKLMPSRPFRDFHTVQTVPSAIAKRPATRRAAVAAAGQKINTIITQRDYHMDCVFGVAVWGGADAPAVEAALRKPCFVPYLGRKSCPLSAPMAPKIVDVGDPLAALRLVTLPPFWPKGGTEKNSPDSARPLLIASDTPFDGGRVETRWDAPIDRKVWHFGPRQVHVGAGRAEE